MEITIPIETAGWKFLANGCHGKVFHRQGCDWIIKHAANDGTRTYLEWVWLKTKRGEKMRGMPELDFVVGVNEASYVVGMRKYKKLRDHMQDVGITDLTYPLHEKEGFPAYMHELLKVFAGECPSARQNDLHSENFMVDGKTLILIDPSAAQYRPIGVTDNQDSPEIFPPVDNFELVG